MDRCTDLFQKKQALNLERQETDIEVARLSQIQRSRMPSEDEFLEAQRAAEKAAKDPANADAVKEAIEAEKKPGVNIGAGQPVNYVQKLRDFPEQVVAEYAVMTRSLREGGRAAMPDQFDMNGYSSPKRRAAMLQTLSGRGDVKSWLRVIANSGDKFQGLVDDVVVVRFAHDMSKAAYIEGAGKLFDWVKNNPGKAVPGADKTKLLNQFKVALMAQRHYDYIRGAWARIGHSMQGKGFEGPLKEFSDPAVVGAVDEAVGMVSESEAAAGIIKAGEMSPEDLSRDSSYGRLLEAMDKAQTKPGEAEKQLAIEVGIIKIAGVDPEKVVDPKEIFYNRLHNYNLLTKDWQLFNERSNALNGGSNAMMALIGPYRTYWEDFQLYQDTVGTSISRPAIEAWQTNFNGVYESMLAIRDAGKQVFMDSFFDGRNMYGNNVDTYGKRYQSPEELVAELHDLAQGGIDPEATGWRSNAQRGLSWINPERYGRYFHAATRLWLYEKTGKSFFLRPGLRTMGAVDNVAGYAAAVYKVRHDLEVEARLGGSDQLNFFPEGRSREEGQRAMDTWITQEFNKSFYSSQPTEHQIKAYRREMGTTAEFLDDQAIADRIATERVGKEGKYGGMVPGDRTRAASEFSDEMRFTNKPGEPGSETRKMYDRLQALRQNAWVEGAVPYFTAPFLGTAFDLEMTGAFPLIRETFFKQDMTPAQIRRNRANLIMAGHVWALAATLGAAGVVVGNGPLNAKDRQAWLLRMKQQGKVPNSIAGVPMPGGFPIINTVFLLNDIAENMGKAMFSKYDQISVVEAAVGVLVGHLSRSSAIGQVKTLFEVAYANPDQQDRTGTFLGYMAAGRYLPSGPIRAAERTFNSRQRDLYRDEDWTENDFETMDAKLMETWERRLRDAAYSVTGLSGAFGGQYKDKDWLGKDIRKPWAMDMLTYLQHRFDPVMHPENDKVYGQLEYLDLLNKPAELHTRRLLDVPMTDDMQKIWNDTYGSIKGSDQQLIKPMRLKAGAPLLNILDPSLVRVREDLETFNVDVAPYLYEHVNGKTFVEAARSLINSPMYQNWESNDALTYGKDAPKKERTKAPAYQMMYHLKRHYASMVEERMLNMENAPAAVQRWRELHTQKKGTIQQQLMDFSGKSPLLDEAAARTESFATSLDGAQ